MSCFYLKFRVRQLSIAQLVYDEVRIPVLYVPMKKAYLLVSFVLVYIHFGVG
jgi:hypothetical protein